MSTYLIHSMGGCEDYSAKRSSPHTTGTQRQKENENGGASRDDSMPRVRGVGHGALVHVQLAEQSSQKTHYEDVVVVVVARQDSGDSGRGYWMDIEGR